MAKFNVLSSIADRLGTTYFTAEQKRRIILAVNAFNNVQSDLKGFIIEAFRLLLVSDTSFKKEELVRMVEQVAYESDPVKYVRVSEGETWCLDINLKEGEDFTGSFLTARNKEDNTLLSPSNIAGASYTTNPIQQIPISDMALTANSFYFINFNVETNNGGSASGDVTSKLAEVVLIADKDVDV